MQPLRILIVDDNFVVRGGLRSSLELTNDLVVVGEAADGYEGVRLAEELLPDLVLTDIRMPGLDGIAATRRLTEIAPNIRVLVLTWSEDVQHLIQAVLAGAKGYLVHGTFTPEELTQAVRTICAGGALITPALAPALLELVRETATRPLPAGTAESTRASSLTPRELEVLELVRGGLSNRAIAERLCIEEKTVKNHINNIYSKLQFRSRYEAIAARSISPPA
ncbi:MAG TPA: response regulator transcription factor [Chloroflexota bacterium]|nr:response regulator transcription factor [Chloroflexota bacterium]